MKRRIFGKLVLLLFLIVLPLSGVWVKGHDLTGYLEFPPRTQYVQHAPFSWLVFVGLALIIFAVMVPFLIRIVLSNRPGSTPPATTSTSKAIAGIDGPGLPWWGWLAMILGLVFWILAWTRFSWFESFQIYTFTPQWLCYIVTINALTYRRTGRCLLTHNNKYFLWLFPLSAAFWWFFEYLNRFVQNWYYTASNEFTPIQYFLAATLPFATVLPAVLSTEEWLATHPRNTAGLESFLPIRFKKPKWTAWITLLVSAAGLFFIGWFPDYLFPLLWVAPLLLLLTLQVLEGEPSFFPEVSSGDWRRIYRLCLAALICGFFWELWNWQSFAQWIYSVPFVHHFKLFEMPILGYAGYLPFGLECAVIADLIRNRKLS